MFDKSIFDSLNITGRNTLKDSSLYSVSANYTPDVYSNEVSNYIMNSNLENQNIIK